MSMPIVAHVRTKSQTKGSARTLCLDLAVYANDCCGVAWPSDETLYHDVNVSRQRIHELKHVLMAKGEVIIVPRPGHTNLYFMAAHGQPLGPQGEYLTTKRGQHEPTCPRRRPVSEISDPPPRPQVSETSDPQVSEISDGGCQKILTQQQEKTREKTRQTVSLSHDHGADAPTDVVISMEVMRKFGIRHSVDDWPPRRPEGNVFSLPEQRIVLALQEAKKYWAVRQTK